MVACYTLQASQCGRLGYHDHQCAGCCSVSEASGVEGEPAQDERGIRELPAAQRHMLAYPTTLLFLFAINMT